MDPDVPVYPLPALLVSLCECPRPAIVSGVTPVSPRTQGQPGYRRRGYGVPCGRRTSFLLLPTFLLLFLLLALGTCLLLLRQALIQGTDANTDPDRLDLLRGEEEDEGEEEKEEWQDMEDASPSWMLLTSTSVPVSTTSSLLQEGDDDVKEEEEEEDDENVPTLGTGLASSDLAPSFTAVTTTLPPGSGHARKCNETEKSYCVNNGECFFIPGINQIVCKCPSGYFGPRCLQPEPLRQHMPKPNEKAEELYQKRVLTITGICVALLVVGIVCVVAYCKTNLPPRKQRKKMHNHLRQNMCMDHPNRSLANGPNHPGPGPEEIPMVDYISKNVPATERVIRHGAEASFSGSCQSSRSHNSSTRVQSSTHRHEERTWGLERADSMLSDCPSGMLSSSVGTSKCSSPACMEARARRAGHCSYPEHHRPPLQYGDSFDSLGDSPHSDRYVSALTTPARLSPVDFHYSLPPQVPTFQITSPNASHAASLPPAAHAPYPPEEDQPLLRHYQVPLHEAQRHEPYRQQRQQQQQYQQQKPPAPRPLASRGYVWQDGAQGSLPSSPYRLTQDEEYESTQEYPSAPEQPKRSSRRWHRSRLNGHVAPRGYRPPQDLGSRTCLSDSESEEEDGESTPFLSMQNMSTPEPSTIYRPAPAPTPAPDTRTSIRGQGGRHSGGHSGGQSRQTHSRSKPDSSAR